MDSMVAFKDSKVAVISNWYLKGFRFFGARDAKKFPLINRALDTKLL
jgi:hypothetical protein